MSDLKIGDSVLAEFDKTQEFKIIQAMPIKGNDYPDGLTYLVRGSVSKKEVWTNLKAIEKGTLAENSIEETGLNEWEPPIDDAHKDLAPKLLLEILKKYAEPIERKDSYLFQSPTNKKASVEISKEDSYFLKGCSSGIPCGCSISMEFGNAQQEGSGEIATYEEIQSADFKEMIERDMERMGFKKKEYEQLTLF